STPPAAAPITRTPRSTLFPYTTLFRSRHDAWLFGLSDAPDTPATDLCGYSLLMWAPDEVHLLNITVRPEMQGRGIGGSMLAWLRSEEHTSELQSRENLVCRLLLEKKK